MSESRLTTISVFSPEWGVYFENELRNFSERLLGPALIRESALYTLLGPGKRIRARLCFATGKFLGMTTKALLPAAAAIEMIHAYTLIHDDLPCMDNDDWRRGRPTNHRQFNEPTALLAGDALLALAGEALLESTAASDRKLLALRRLFIAAGGKGVIQGQLAELHLHSGRSEIDLEEVFVKKTAALFETSVGMALDLASETDSRSQALLQYAREIGICFQAADDLEDPLPLTGGFPPRHLLHLNSFVGAKASVLSRLLTAENILRIAAQDPEKLNELLQFAESIRKKVEACRPQGVAP